VFRLRHGEHAMLVVVAAALWFPLWYVLGLLKGSAPPIDAAITSLSIVAQWLLNRRVLENWAWWIVIDLISIPLYLSRGLPLIAALYLVFLALCVQGFFRWRRHVAPQPEVAAA
jgi:nicotinamide mononucleotide transporter